MRYSNFGLRQILQSLVRSCGTRTYAMTLLALASIALPVTASANPNLAGPGIPGLGYVLALGSLLIQIAPFLLLVLAYKRAQRRTLTKGKMYFFLAPAFLFGIFGMLQTLMLIGRGFEMEHIDFVVTTRFVALDFAYLAGAIFVYRHCVEKLSEPAATT